MSEKPLTPGEIFEAQALSAEIGAALNRNSEQIQQLREKLDDLCDGLSVSVALALLATQLRLVADHAEENGGSPSDVVICAAAALSRRLRCTVETKGYLDVN